MKKSLLIFAVGTLLSSMVACNFGADKNVVEEKMEEVGNNTAEGDGHNAENSLDIAGSYHGIVPCTDCEGIETKIVLNKDKTFIYSTKYLGKSEEKIKTTGVYTFLPGGSTIQLIGVYGASNKYFVGENALIQLDTKGEKIQGELADKYMLIK